jgi:RNA polymerase sigma-70 factor (ECF subfamily)
MRFIRFLRHVAISVLHTSLTDIYQAAMVRTGVRARESTGRRVSRRDVDALLDLAAANARTIDPPEESLAEDLLRAMDGLPRRSREILLAALLEGQSYRALSKRFGVSVRQIEREIRRGIEHCASSRPRS